MRKIQLTLLLLLLTVTATFAQRGATHGGQAMLEQLDLSTQQQTAIAEIRKDTRTQMKALRDNGKDRAANREAAKAIREKSKSAVLAVLSPAQRQQLEDQKAARKEAWAQVDKKAMRAELKAYRTEKMEPVLRAARGQMDQYIDQADRQEIDRLRAVFATRPGGKAKGEGRGKGKRDEAARDQARAEAKQWRTDHAEDAALLKALTKKYQTELQRAEKVLAPQRETWRKNMAEIKAKYLPESAAKRPKGRAGKAGNGKAGKGKRRAAEREQRPGTDRKAAAFLLLKS